MAAIVNCSWWKNGLDDLDSVIEVLSVNISMGVLDTSPVISDAAMDDINIYVNLLLRASIAVFGVVTNIVNMVVFWRLGIKDSNSVGLVALSFTDFLVTLLGIAGTVCFTLDTLLPNTAIDSIAVDYVSFGWARDVAYLISGWITTLLSIERCVCVISPFQVRRIFTRARSVIAVAVLYVLVTAVHMPIFVTQWLDWSVVDCRETEDGTVVLKKRMVVHTSANRDQVHDYIDIANGAVLPIPSQAIVLISVIWMIYGLRASSRIRKTSTAAGETSDKSKDTSNLSRKESRLVKVVLFLAIILTICNVPRFLAIYAKHIFKDVSFGNKYSNLYLFLWNISVFASVVNSSVNIFIYLLINSNYRREIKELFGISEKNDESRSGIVSS